MVMKEGTGLASEGLRIDSQVAELVITQFIRNEVGKAGFHRVVMGLSGGIDSTVGCYLAAKALGPENVLALCMPHEVSSPESLEHARLVIDELGVASDTIDITPMVKAVEKAVGGMSPNRRGNVMSRTRMLLLFDRSAAWDALVLGTSNKSELLLGYGTIYGDLASAVNPIGDLYKTQVRQLAQSLGVPQVIIDKQPSADLRRGQTDERELGFTYADADRLLYLLVDERYQLDEAAAAGFDSGFINIVWQKVRQSQFKRTMPIIPKISSRTISHDFRYLRDWGT